MKVKWILMGMVLSAMVVGMTSVALAADAAEDYVQAPAAHWHEVDNDFMKKFHNPMEGLTMGLDIRLRQVYAENMFSMDQQYGDASAKNKNKNIWQYGRYRARWSAKYQLSEDIDFNTRLVWEFRDWHNPDYKNQDVDFDEALFDHMNVQIRNAFDMPLTLTIGRQDIILGTGWLVLDGTPYDGSRTIYFDAIRGTYELSDATKLDMIYIQQYDNETKWLKPLDHDITRHATNGQDERGLIFYLTNKCGDQQRELYYIFKNDENSGLSNSTTKDSDIHTIGGRLAGKLDENWSYSAELAKQWGKVDEESMRAWGTNNTLTYAFNDEKQSKVFVMYEFLSGDEPDTAASEQFETLWGDWPQSGRGGDLQSYIWSPEGNVGQVSNLQRLGFGHSFKPSDVWTMQTMYNLMWADERTYKNSGSGIGPWTTTFGNGKFRGQMFTGLLTYQCCKNFRTQFLLDYFLPGSYYDTSTNEAAMFARVNVEWTF
ncbi:MAG: alginate export family protein [Phycisphaerae bacterium]|nr:alginate export family protein [Phycisphaerae bacterium]